MADPNYIVRVRDGEFDVVGPFASGAELAAWGRRDQAAAGDDPNWQSVLLEGDRRPAPGLGEVRVVPPAPGRPGRGEAYVLRVADDDLFLVGPFAGRDELDEWTEWLEAAAAGPGDPRWWAVELPPSFRPRVLSPREAEAERAPPPRRLARAESARLRRAALSACGELPVGRDELGRLAVDSRRGPGPYCRSPGYDELPEEEREAYRRMAEAVARRTVAALAAGAG